MTTLPFGHEQFIQPTEANAQENPEVRRSDSEDAGERQSYLQCGGEWRMEGRVQENLQDWQYLSDAGTSDPEDVRCPHLGAPAEELSESSRECKTNLVDGRYV